MSNRIATALAGSWICPVSGEALSLSGDSLVSDSGARYPVSTTQIRFLDAAASEGFEARRDSIDRLKAFVKSSLGRYYHLLPSLLSPVMPRIHWRSGKVYWRHVVDRHVKEGAIVLQMGSGNVRLHDQVINVDIFGYPEVDLVADCTRLPLRDGSVDGIISMAMLEHVEDPEAFVREASRVLKAGGFIITGVPFMQGFHASPSDFYRWTAEGLLAFHQRHGFSEGTVEPIAGPSSSLAWILRDWLAVGLSFNIRPLYYAMLAVFSLAVQPIKLLDLILIHYKDAWKISSFNLYVGRKGAPGQRREPG